MRMWEKQGIVRTLEKSVRNLLIYLIFRLNGDTLKKNRFSFRDSFILFLKGIGMGAADIIPGVSGGTIALITGIYENLIEAINSIDPKFIIYFFRILFDRKYLTKSKERLLDIHLKFLLSLAAGIIVAFLVLANILGWLLDEYPTYTYAFFFGLILSSAFFVYKSSKNPFNLKSVLLLGIGMLSGFYIVSIQTIQTDHSILLRHLILPF